MKCGITIDIELEFAQLLVFELTRASTTQSRAQHAKPVCVTHGANVILLSFEVRIRIRGCTSLIGP
jgi:hypothetical protein